MDKNSDVVLLTKIKRALDAACRFDSPLNVVVEVARALVEAADRVEEANERAELRE